MHVVIYVTLRGGLRGITCVRYLTCAQGRFTRGVEVESQQGQRWAKLTLPNLTNGLTGLTAGLHPQASSVYTSEEGESGSTILLSDDPGIDASRPVGFILHGLTRCCCVHVYFGTSWLIVHDEYIHRADNLNNHSLNLQQEHRGGIE